MLWSSAMKAGAMAWRGGALSGPGKVECVIHILGRLGLVGGGGHGRSVHATANRPRHGDPFPSACLSCLIFNISCAGKEPCQGGHAQVHPYTPTGKGRVLRGGIMSTTHTGTGTGSGGGSTQMDHKYESIKLVLAVVGTIAAVSGSTAVAVRHHVEDKAATEMARI